jgi:hypothetical protein
MKFRGRNPRRFEVGTVGLEVGTAQTLAALGLSQPVPTCPTYPGTRTHTHACACPHTRIAHTRARRTEVGTGWDNRA